MNNPDYHLRPNKAVDRNLFIESLVHLRKMVNISEYRYIGFGSYEFDEFKSIYRTLGIEDLHSIEMDPEVYKRQMFNRPYSFIQLYNKTFGEYIDEDYDGAKKSIVWADFTEANKKNSQCQDISNISSKMGEGDILRITLNANPTGISTGGKQTCNVAPEERKKIRLNALKEELSEYMPDGACADDLTHNRYPLLLLKIIRKAIYQDLDVNLSPCPLCSYVYSDNTQMLTITILMCSVEKRKYTIERVIDTFNDWDSYVNIDSWDRCIRIDLPSLTVHEQLEICQYEKNENGARRIEEKMGIKSDELERFLRFARYYPNYQPVTI